MKHKNNEFYTSTEYKEVGEYKGFDAELYRKSIDYNPTPDENAKTGPETQFANSDEPIPEKKPQENKSKRQKFVEAFDKLKSSLSSIGGSAAGTVVVAATAVFVCIALFIAPPKADSFTFYSGADYISFSFEISEMSSDMDYDIVLYNEAQQYVIDEVYEGVFEGVFENLTPKTDYSLSLIGTTKEGITEEYVSKSVFTLPYEPTISIFDTKASYNKIHISLELNGLDLDTHYYLELSNGERIEVQQGNNEYVFEALSENTSYAVSLIGSFRDIDALYDSSHIDTLLKFNGKIIPPNISSSVVTWSDEYNEITLPFVFEKDENNYQYGVILTDEEGNEISSYYGIDNAPVFNTATSYEKINIDYQLIYKHDKETVVCEEFSLGLLDLSAPLIDISQDKAIAGISTYSIPFEVSSRIENLEMVGNLSYVLSYADAQDISGYSYDWISNRPCSLIIELPIGVSEFSLRFILEYEEMYGGNLRRIETQPVTYTNELEFSLLDAYADFSYYGGNQGYLEFGYFAPEGSYVEVTYNGQAEIIDGAVYTFDASGVQTFTYLLKDIDGIALSEPRDITFNSDFDKEHSYYSINPSEVFITANEDDTINLYLDVRFEAENPDIFYEIEYGDNIFRSREYIAKIENVPMKSYGISHQILAEKNGIRYILSKTHPSGSTEIKTKNSVMLNKFDTGMRISSYHEFKPNSEITITLNNSIYKISSNDFIYDSEISLYYYEIEYSEPIVYADVTCYLPLNSTYEFDDFIATHGDIIKGELYIKITKIYEENY